MSNTEELDEFPVKVDNDVYGPIKLDRIISDVKEGKLTDEAKFWDGEDWVPVSILLDDGGIFEDKEGPFGTFQEAKENLKGNLYDE